MATVAVSAVQEGRRRRPSGEAPPLPRHLPPGTRWYLTSLAATVALWAALLVPATLSVVTRGDLAVLRLLADIRSPALTWVCRAVALLGSEPALRVLGWTTIAILLASRRFQHLVAYLVALLAGSFLETVAAARVGRLRPEGLHILGHWQGYANPSRPVAGLALVLAGATYMLAPAGRTRVQATRIAMLLLALLCAARLYLAVDHPTDVLAGLAVGWALPALLYAWGMPDEAYPVTYRHRTRAHLDIGGRRGEAIREALDHQLGLRLVSVEPFGLGGSAGSSPVRLLVQRGDAEQVLFGKLYAVSHLRSDRLYKVVRSIRYGRLEDERSFSSVRRLVEYEDHLLRLFRDLGLPTPQPHGVVELTPEREYLILMEFFAGARELGAAVATTTEIDEGLVIVRAMWDGGVAHRDIKPSNLLVGGERVLLIDLAFAAVRPTPWRQAVDLADMMLSLALASSADVVYQRALRLFTPEDVAEAFAASRGVTIPAQLKSRLKADGRDLIAQFRALAPSRSPVAIQRWTLRRVASTVGVAAGIAVALWGAAVYARTAGLL